MCPSGILCYWSSTSFLRSVQFYGFSYADSDDILKMFLQTEQTWCIVSHYCGSITVDKWCQRHLVTDIVGFIDVLISFWVKRSKVKVTASSDPTNRVNIISL